MPNVPVSDETMAQVAAFRPVIEAVIEDSVTDEACVDFLLRKGIEGALHDLLQQQGPETLLVTIQRLGTLFPERVYWFVAEALRQGAIIVAEEQKELLRPFGFHAHGKPNPQTEPTP